MPVKNTVLNVNFEKRKAAIYVRETERQITILIKLNILKQLNVF
jgi:hypothetical protein